MTGTIIVAEGRSFDVRTIDFMRIVKALQTRKESTDIAEKLLQSVDEFGINMICAGELNRKEFLDFHCIFTAIRDELLREEGMAQFLERVCHAAEADERFISI